MPETPSQRTQAISNQPTKPQPATATAHETPDLAGALARTRRPVEPQNDPPTPLLARIKMKQTLPGLLPTRLAIPFAEHQGRVAWRRSAEERERARAAIVAIVAGTPRAGEIEQLAREHVIEKHVEEAFFWRKWKTPRLDPLSRQRLEQAFEADRAVLISACHIGPFFLGAEAVHMLGRTQYSVAAPWLFQAPPPGPWGVRLAHWSRAIGKRGDRLIYSVGSFEVIKALLEQRDIVKLYFDMPGSLETQFLGKSVMLSGGSARLAMQTEALVVPTRLRRTGHRMWIDAAPALDARDFADEQELHEALAAVHERWVLELPATLEDPNRDGAWERGATASAWVRPRDTQASSREPQSPQVAPPSDRQPSSAAQRLARPRRTGPRLPSPVEGSRLMGPHGS